MVQISSGGFLPILIWTSYFRLAPHAALVQEQEAGDDRVFC
jgi:hypothetical protein